MFDSVEIRVLAGRGGDGAVSFRREKYVPFGGPDGGDGGDGGDVIITGDATLTDLRMFGQRRLYRAGNGENGKGKNKHGKKGNDLLLRVPVGTVAWEIAKEGDNRLIVDCEESGQQAIVVKGGQGGWGNTHFATSTNQVPRLAQKGTAGEENYILLELRLIADVGVIGYPNVGKSTLLTTASAAKPKIASYPFTTLEPVLGVVEVGYQTVVLAEIPGLLDGAHLGRGLGHDFLRHIMRTKILIHLIDGTSASPVEDMTRVNMELSLFDPALGQKPQLVVVNKVDLPEVRDRLTEMKEAFSSVGTPVHFVSASKGEGVSELVDEAKKMLAQIVTRAEAGQKIPKMVFQPQPRVVGLSVHKEGDTFIVTAPELERIVARVDATVPEVFWQLRGQMVRLGVNKALEKAGVKPGDKVRCGDFEWEW